MERMLASDIINSEQTEKGDQQPKTKEEIEMIKNNYLQKKREKKAQAKDDADVRRKNIEAVKQVIADIRAQRRMSRDHTKPDLAKSKDRESIDQDSQAPLDS